MQGFIFFDSDAAEIESKAEDKIKSEWEKFKEEARKILTKENPLLADAGMEIIKLVIFSGPQAIKNLPQYLSANLGFGAVQSQKISAELAKNILGRFLTQSTAHLHEIKWGAGKAAEGAVLSEDSTVEEEVKEHARRTKEILEHAARDARESHDETAARILKASGVELKSDEQAKRILTILKSMLKDVRTDQSAIFTLKREFELGGAGLDAANSFKLAKITKEEIEADEKELRRMHLINKSKEKNTADTQDSQEKKGTAIENAPPHSLQIIPQEPNQKQNMETKIQPQKQVVDDIVLPQTLVSPTEELGNFRPIDFRRLSPKPALAASKIKDKINLLREDSFESYLNGIKAWRSSPIYRIYLNMLKFALQSGKIEYANDAAADFKAPAAGAEPEELLTKDEVLAILKMNREFVI